MTANPGPERVPAAPLELPTPHLTAPSLVFELDGARHVFPIPEGATTLGSARDNDLILPHASVRPHQVVIMRAGADVELRDLFAGHTLVNGQPRHSGPLVSGDVLDLGEVRLRVLQVQLPPGSEQPGQEEEEETETGRFRRFSTRDVDEDQLERSLFAGQGGELDPGGAPAPDHAPAAGSSADGPDESGTARFETNSFQPGAEVDVSALRRLPAPVDTRRVLRTREARRARALARARQLSDDVRSEPDFERLLERLALAFLDVFAADRAVAVLFEEDGKNPLLTVERSREGGDAPSGAGIAPEIVERCLQAGTVIRVTGGEQGLDGLAAPLLGGERALGLLYFERPVAPREAGTSEALELEDVHLMGLLANQAALVIAPLVS